MILSCISEILSNFWKHATDDAQSIIMAVGKSDRIEIACVDTGNGIVSTLRNTLSTRNASNTDILAKALNKGTTSKIDSNHMGYGLWIIDEIVSKTKSRLHIYSEGCSVKNDYGVRKKGQCGYWKGTIVSLILYLKEPVTYQDILNQEDKDALEQIKIDFS